MKNYELIEHTADVGIRVKGADLQELFVNAALAMFDIIAERKTPETKALEKITVAQKADDLEELFLNWLNELLSLSATRELIFSDFTFSSLDNNNLHAILCGSSIANYRINTEIKAATYHELKIEKTPSGWQAEVIFDV